MSQPKTLRALLAGWRPAGEHVHVGGEAGALAAAWEDAVGDDVARRTRASGYRDGTLRVITPSSAWSHQLTFLAPTIIERLRARCPGVDLRKLAFVVATGRSRALLARQQRAAAFDARVAGARAVRSNGAKSENASAAQVQTGDDPAQWLSALRNEQTQLDQRRKAQGWRQCAACERWIEPAPRAVRLPAAAPHGAATLCEPCAQAQRRAADGAIAQLIAAAPWLRFEEHKLHAAQLERHAYERVRRALLAQWERQAVDARARLRRGALEAADRVVAWSYVMLALHVPQDKVSAAVLASTLGQKWADALLAPRATRSGTRDRKAPHPAREK